ncbi:MAG: hypothetical protein EOO02_22630 [Chitinophagaceae bacterium]|nr:MAG: hypothetical protein EOO02_22630 [Chitinophagaceae bacterium]
MRKISTFSGRLQQEYADQLPEKAKLFLEKIANATSRMYAMIDGVLSYSTLNASEQPMARIDLDKIMQHIESDLEVPIQYKKAIINKCNLPEIDGAEVLIYQLFYNLINNSLKFSRSEVAPVITISSSIASKDEKDFAVIEVADNGIGFTGDEAERIFNSFTRLHGKDKYEGTGLGLALCRKIAERHHGFINAAGNEGKGAIFTVWLPLKQDQLTI